jgi:hypothetical protein
MPSIGYIPVSGTISPDVSLASIKTPTKGKRVTRDEFREEQNKMMKELERNNQRGGQRIMIRN